MTAAHSFPACPGAKPPLTSAIQFFTVCMSVVVILADRAFGWDRHIWDIEANEITKSNIIAFIAKLVFTLASTFTRLSLCCFYYRLVKDSDIKWFERAVHGTVAFTVVICLIFVFLTIFLCSCVFHRSLAACHSLLIETSGPFNTTGSIPLVWKGIACRRAK